MVAPGPAAQLGLVIETDNMRFRPAEDYEKPKRCTTCVRAKRDGVEIRRFYFIYLDKLGTGIDILI